MSYADSRERKLISEDLLGRSPGLDHDLAEAKRLCGTVCAFSSAVLYHHQVRSGPERVAFRRPRCSCKVSTAQTCHALDQAWKRGLEVRFQVKMEMNSKIFIIPVANHFCMLTLLSLQPGYPGTEYYSCRESFWETPHFTHCVPYMVKTQLSGTWVPEYAYGHPRCVHCDSLF